MGKNFKNPWAKGGELYPYEVLKNVVSKATSLTHLPSVKLEEADKNKFPINTVIMIRLKVEGVPDNSWGGTKYDIELSCVNTAVTLTSKTFVAEEGWVLITKNKSSYKGEVDLVVKVNKKFINSIKLKFFNPKCMGDRDLTVAEVKSIVKILREKTYYTWENKKYPLTQLPYYSIDKIFQRNDKSGKYVTELVLNTTFENFTTQLNTMFNKYDINTCKRRRHFLAQAFIETMYFSSTIENGVSLSYDPYRGRGFLHLTHDYNYRKYKKATGEDITDDNEDNLEKLKLVSTNLWYAADTAGWFWKFGSVKGNINLIADIGTVEQVTRAIQGGKRALKERMDAYNLLLTIFKDGDC